MRQRAAAVPSVGAGAAAGLSGSQICAGTLKARHPPTPAPYRQRTVAGQAEPATAQKNCACTASCSLLPDRSSAPTPFSCVC